MKSANRLLLGLILIFFFSCQKESDDVVNSPLSKIQKSGENNFVTGKGNSFFPWGFNYTNPDHVGLLDDNWMDAAVWQVIIEDFNDMKSLGANIVRIHLQYNRFMNNETTPNEAALDKLLDIVTLAEEKELYLDITGLAAYRQSDSPDWYDAMEDTQRWNTQKRFWQSVAKKVGHSPAVFAYNLMNEPVVSVGCTQTNECSWLPGNSFGGFHFVQNISKDPSKTYANTIKEWAGIMTDAIRMEDQMTMITIGFLGLGDLTQFGESLDYLSVHLYPQTGMIQKSIDYVHENSSKPLVIEETSNLHCTIVELEEFVDGIDGSYHGLLGHYRGKNFDELDEADILDVLQINFLEFFIRRNPNI